MLSGAGPGGGFAAGSEEASPGVVGAAGGDALLQHARDEGFHHQAGAYEPEARVLAVRGGHHSVARPEGVRGVVGAEQGGELFQGPVGAGTPRCAGDEPPRDGVGVVRDLQGRRAVGGAGGAPPGSVRHEAAGGVVPSSSWPLSSREQRGRHRRRGAADYRHALTRASSF